jgi:hypothetical protein
MRGRYKITDRFDTTDYGPLCRCHAWGVTVIDNGLVVIASDRLPPLLPDDLKEDDGGGYRGV